MEDEELMKRRGSLPEEELKEGYTDTEESFSAALEGYRALQEGAPAEAAGKGKGGAAPGEGDASSRGLFEASCAEGTFVEYTEPRDWPDTSAGIREVLGAPANFIGPGHLMSDDWV